MSHDLTAETASRLGQIRDLESELADLHGYRRAPHGTGGSLDRIDPSAGERLTLGCVISRIRREAREAAFAARADHHAGRQLVARDQVGEGEEQAAEQGSAGVHDHHVRAATIGVQSP